jgi:hypothetical protein
MRIHRCRFEGGNGSAGQKRLTTDPAFTVGDPEARVFHDRLPRHLKQPLHLRKDLIGLRRQLVHYDDRVGPDEKQLADSALDLAGRVGLREFPGDSRPAPSFFPKQDVTGLQLAPTMQVVPELLQGLEPLSADRTLPLSIQKQRVVDLGGLLRPPDFVIDRWVDRQ